MRSSSVEPHVSRDPADTRCIWLHKQQSQVFAWSRSAQPASQRMQDSVPLSGAGLSIACTNAPAMQLCAYSGPSKTDSKSSGYKSQRFSFSLISCTTRARCLQWQGRHYSSCQSYEMPGSCQRAAYAAQTKLPSMPCCTNVSPLSIALRDDKYCYCFQCFALVWNCHSFSRTATCQQYETISSLSCYSCRSWQQDLNCTHCCFHRL